MVPCPRDEGPIGGPVPRSPGCRVVLAAVPTRAARDGDPDAVRGSGAPGPLVLDIALVWSLHAARQICVDPERSGVGPVLGDAGVLAHGEPETPPVKLEDTGRGAGGEAVAFRCAEPHLVIGHPG